MMFGIFLGCYMLGLKMLNPTDNIPKYGCLWDLMGINQPCFQWDLVSYG